MRELNPRVTIKTEEREIIESDADIYGSFDIVIATDLAYSDLTRINDACRAAKRPFYATGSVGIHGYAFADLLSHDYVVQRDKSNIPTSIATESSTRSVVEVSIKTADGKSKEVVTKRERYSPLSQASTAPLPAEYVANRRRLRGVTHLLPCLRALWRFQTDTGRSHPNASDVTDIRSFTTLAMQQAQELHLPAETMSSERIRIFLTNVGSELAPTAALIGGTVAQDVIHVLGHQEQPLQNLMLFDGNEMKAPIYAMHDLPS